MSSQVIFDTDPEQLFNRAVTLFAEKIASIQTSIITVALPGGRSVEAFLNALVKNAGLISSEVWSRIHFFMVDERLVSISDAESNFRIINELCFKRLVALSVIKAEQVHPFRMDSNLPDYGISAYETELEQCGGRFSVVILGVGEDGHIAALFPGHGVLASEHKGFLLLDDSPKPPRARMTSSLVLIKTAEIGFGLFLGPSKREAYSAYITEKGSIQSCPAKILNELPCSYVITDLENN